MYIDEFAMLAAFLLVLFGMYTKALHRVGFPTKTMYLVCVSLAALLCAGLLFAYWFTHYLVG